MMIITTGSSQDNAKAKMLMAIDASAELVAMGMALK
jgi:hypothetical protein